jgi:hypothetical protein
MQVATARARARRHRDRSFAFSDTLFALSAAAGAYGWLEVGRGAAAPLCPRRGRLRGSRLSLGAWPVWRSLDGSPGRDLKRCALREPLSSAPRASSRPTWRRARPRPPPTPTTRSVTCAPSPLPPLRASSSAPPPPSTAGEPVGCSSSRPAAAHASETGCCWAPVAAPRTPLRCPPPTIRRCHHHRRANGGGGRRCRHPLARRRRNRRRRRHRHRRLCRPNGGSGRRRRRCARGVGFLDAKWGHVPHTDAATRGAVPCACLSVCLRRDASRTHGYPCPVCMLCLVCVSKALRPPHPHLCMVCM